MTEQTPREPLSARESAPQAAEAVREGAGGERAADGRTAFPSVQGRCPACRGASLFLGNGGHITCARLDCPNPTAVDDLLHGEPAPAHNAGPTVAECAAADRVWPLQKEGE